MIMSDNDKLEQLWYTWSPIGLGVTTEYRVRAASRDLLDIRNERYKRMDPYLRYTLPQGVDPYGIPLEKAPTCLAFIDVGQERILIRKKYIGRDLVGRPGNFFSHLVAIPKPTAGDASDDIYSPPASNSPSPVFTAWDAISLWESDFWAKSDTLDANTLELQPTTHSELKSLSPYANAQPLSMMDSTKVEKYLPIVIQAFLTYGARMRLYMATQPEMVAALIWGLTRSMPQQLLTDLTFSTYETDYQRSPCQIVGTCWLSGKGDPQTTPQHFPPICYENGNLAINDYTGKCSVLDERTSEASFARFATQYWLGRGDPQYSPKGLLDKAEKPELNIGTPSDFLVLYKFYTAQSLTKEYLRTL